MKWELKSGVVLVGFFVTCAAFGDAMFADAVHYAAGTGARFVAVADLDGDDVPDLAVANQYNVSVLLGVGDGTFTAAVGHPAGGRPYSVAIGDLDGDQVPDLAVASDGEDEGAYVLLGIGDGTFAAAVHYPAGVSPSSVAIGDLDGDQVPDLAVGNWDGGNVSVLLGVGDGTFAAAVNYTAGTQPRSVAIGDLDGDQAPDLVVASWGSDNLSVLLGVGDGTFAGAVGYPAGGGPASVAIGDLNGDQVPDLAAANSGPPPAYDESVSVLLGAGDGTFADAVYYAAGDEPWSVAIGDLDDDQVPDLAVANAGYPNSGSVSVLLGVGDGTFADAVHYAAGDVPRSVAIGDLDGDGRCDLVTANQYSGDVSVLLNQSVTLGDLNCDGVVNFFDIEPFVLAIMYETAYAEQYPDCDIMAADCNGDGAVDFFDIDGFVELITGG